MQFHMYSSFRTRRLPLVVILTLLPVGVCFGQTAAVVTSGDGHSSQYGTETVDGLSQTILSGYAANHTVTWGATWTGSGNTQQPQVEPVPPTDVVGSSS